MLKPERNSFELDGWVLHPFTDYILAQQFDCGDDDLNDFFRKVEPHEKLLLNKTYVLSRTEEEVESLPPIALISYCNDHIPLKDIKDSVELPEEKRYPYLPAVKIARLGVHKKYCHQGIGSHILNMTKSFFLTQNRTGCRIITVDAYNKEPVVNFYQKNHFAFIRPKETKRELRTMYYDLIRTQLP
jgi:GNAT superfamily N-acetyltransferase